MVVQSYRSVCDIERVSRVVSVQTLRFTLFRDFALASLLPHYYGALPVELIMRQLLPRCAAPVAAFAIAFALPAVSSAATADVVEFSGYTPGTIVVKTSERQLYFVLDGQRARRFPVGVGKTGMTWTGKARVEGKFVRPAWAPPRMIRRDNPRLPTVIAGGAPNNPMGEAALTLRGGEYAIHGTNRPSSIGGFVSYGCIRMYNHDIRELYRLVHVGTPVIVED
jgi:hypothetical protein